MNQNDLTVTNKNINAWWVKIISNTYVYIVFFMVIYVWLYVMISINYLTILWNFLYLCDPIYQHVWPYNHICTYDHIYICIYYVSCHPIFLTTSYMCWSKTYVHCSAFVNTDSHIPVLWNLLGTTHFGVMMFQKPNRTDLNTYRLGPLEQAS